MHFPKLGNLSIIGNFPLHKGPKFLRNIWTQSLNDRASNLRSMKCVCYGVIQMSHRPTYATLLSPYFNLSVCRSVHKFRKAWLFELCLVHTEVLFFYLILVVKCLKNRANTATRSVRYHSTIFSHATHLSVLFTHAIFLPSAMSDNINDITSVTNLTEQSQEIRFLLSILRWHESSNGTSPTYMNSVQATNYTECPTRYRTRHFFINSNTNEDTATKFEQEYVRCVRNE